jgi:hypothetical protein
MTFATVARQAFDSKTIIPVLLAVGAFLVSRFGGQYAQRWHPLLRYAPGLALILAGVAYGARKEGGKLIGIGIAAGAGVDIGMVGLEKAGLLPAWAK